MEFEKDVLLAALHAHLLPTVLSVLQVTISQVIVAFPVVPQLQAVSSVTLLDVSLAISEEATISILDLAFRVLLSFPTAKSVSATPPVESVSPVSLSVVPNVFPVCLSFPTANSVLTTQLAPSVQLVPSQMVLPVSLVQMAVNPV